MAATADVRETGRAAAVREDGGVSDVEQRRGRPGYDRAGILAVAVATFIEHGYDATSIAMLAGRLGLSKSAIYHHFASKEALLAASLDAALGGLEAVATESEAVGGPA